MQGILEAETIKQVKMKKKKRIKKNYLKGTRKLLEIKLYYRNLIKEINKYPGYPSSKILGTILEVDEGGTSTNGRENKKLMTMHKTLHCPWCNGRKWTRRHEFKSWTWLIAFHIALITLGKVSIQLFSLQLWVNSRADWILQPWWGN